MTANAVSPQSLTVIPTAGELGVKVDHVVLDIDYHIIEHFSKHLYSSPNKAIEELVCNGFDAWATDVRVYLPEGLTREHVVVWDNGSSMDIAGLKNLWRIADSTKVGERLAVGPGGTRRMIGKFGIGKLASYTVGGTISHLCRKESQFFAVGVDYSDVIGNEGHKGATKSQPMNADIIAISAEKARQYLKAHFAKLPTEFDELFESPHWTVAIIGALKVKSFQRGRLRWVISNGMPLRPDFVVYVDDDQIASAFAKSEVASWDFASKEVKEALQEYWKAEQKRSNLQGKLSFGSAKGLDPQDPARDVPYAQLPTLGRVWGVARLYDESLVVGRAADTGRSHGFFLMVRGRLLNPDDDKLLLSEPSFATFYKSQFIVHADGLDDDLLADREHIRRDSTRSLEFAVVQRALYLVARNENDKRDQKAAELAKGGTLLPVHSRELFRGPLAEILIRQTGDTEKQPDLNAFSIERRSLGDESPLVIVDGSTNAFAVNSLHPFLRNVEDEFGSGKRAKQLIRVLEQLAVRDALEEGFLHEIGMSDEKIAAVRAWREKYMRTLAVMPIGTVNELAAQLDQASYVPGAAFEDAIVKVLDAMGFEATRDGASGKKDLGVRATCGPSAYSFTFEAKGSKNPVANDAAEIAAAAAHRDAHQAQHAVVVARKFAGFDQPKAGELAAVLKECTSVGGVSIVTTDALVALLRLVRRFGYPLDLIKDVFTIVESPAEKTKRIADLSKPSPGFDWRQLLEDIWTWQGGQYVGDVVPARAILQLNPAWAKNRELFFRNLIALSALAPMLVVFDEAREQVVLRQKPEIVIDAIERSLGLEV